VISLGTDPTTIHLVPQYLGYPERHLAVCTNLSQECLWRSVCTSLVIVPTAFRN